jgi:ATP-dependent helicase/nuclease subunit A
VFALGLETKTAKRAVSAPAAARPLPDFLAIPPAPETPGPRILRPSEAAGAEEPALLSPVAEGGTDRFRRGLLIHALLAALPDIPRAERARMARRYLAGHGIADDAANTLIAETLAILDDPTFAPLFAEGSRGEVAITAELPELGKGVRVSGQIDRLAVKDDAVLVADFKTNRPPPASAEATPALYRAQMALYRAALAKLYPGRRIACALIWTDGARLMALPDALLDAELATIRHRQSTQKLV